jgi:NADP-dependent 3-hydroxy acid dehydrogenase YdfG
MKGIDNMVRTRVSTKSSAVVTGAGSGIGRAFAVELAARAGRVVCADIRLDSARETVRLIEAQGGKALALACDVSSVEAVQALAEESEQWLRGPVDLVVNNAGVGSGGRPIGEVSIEDWRWTVGVNLWGVVHGCHVFAPRLRALGRGGIINVCSAASFAAAPMMGPYNVTKAAVLALSETLRAELDGTLSDLRKDRHRQQRTHPRRHVQGSQPPHGVDRDVARGGGQGGPPRARRRPPLRAPAARGATHLADEALRARGLQPMLRDDRASLRAAHPG